MRLILSLVICSFLFPALGQARPKRKKHAPKEVPAEEAATEQCPVALPSQTAARLGDRLITVQELDDYTQGQVTPLLDQIREIRRAAAEQFVTEELVRAKCQELGLSPEEYVTQELDKRAEDPDEAEVQAYVDENAPEDATDDARKEIADQYRAALVWELRTDAVEELINEILAENDVQFFLKPHRLDIDVTSRPGRGPADAPVTIVEVADYQCPYCAKVQPALKELTQRYPDTVRFVFWDFPLSFHQYALAAASLAHCAGEQDQYWPAHDYLFEHQDSLADVTPQSLAQALSLDAAALDQCANNPAVASQLEQDMQMAQSWGVSGTPSFVVNGILASGALTVDELASMVEEAQKP